MNELFARARAYVLSRPPREHWLMVFAVCVVVALVVQSLAAAPMRARLVALRDESLTLETDLKIAERMGREMRHLQSQLALVEARIRSGEKTNLFTLLENLAGEAGIRNQLESIKPKQPSGSDRYPETRVAVSLRGATLAQTVRFLHEIESAPVLLIIRSLRIKAREDSSQMLDVSFTVSSFERA